MSDFNRLPVVCGLLYGFVRLMYGADGSMYGVDGSMYGQSGVLYGFSHKFDIVIHRS